MPHSISNFQDIWLSKYKWVKRASSSTKAKCCFCKTEFQLGLMGVSALDSHAKSKKHQDICKLREKADAAFAGENFNIVFWVPHTAVWTSSLAFICTFICWWYQNILLLVNSWAFLLRWMLLGFLLKNFISAFRPLFSKYDNFLANNQHCGQFLRILLKDLLSFSYSNSV